MDRISSPSLRAPRFAAAAPVFALGFRPFYLLSAAFAVVSVPAWVLGYAGWLDALPIDLLWHMHEMVFGFAMAVVAGFVLTAAQTWTGVPTPHGRSLQGLVLLWLAGRCAALAANPALYAALDVAFPVAVALILLRVLLRANNYRNVPICVILAVLAADDLLFHATRAGWESLSPFMPVHVAILLITLLISLIGGRVTPMFTRNGAPGSRPRQWPWLDRTCLLLLVIATICWVLAPAGRLAASVLALSAAAHLVRQLAWDPLRALRNPLVWTLHVSQLALVAGLALLAASAVGLAGASSAFHLLAIGGLGGTVASMITRTALGHTGRPLRAGRVETAIYVLLPLAAVLRIAANGLTDFRLTLLGGATVCWVAAFLLYLLRYGPYLCRPRADGRPG